VRKVLDCGIIIPSFCKVGKSIWDQKDVFYLNLQGYKNLCLEVAKQIQTIKNTFSYI